MVWWLLLWDVMIAGNICTALRSFAQREFWRDTCGIRRCDWQWKSCWRDVKEEEGSTPCRDGLVEGGKKLLVEKD